LILALAEHRDGVEVAGGTCAVYDVARDQAHFGSARVQGHALVWELAPTPPATAKLAAEVDVTATADWLMRCDRVDFPPGGIAYTHTHPGPGIRCVLFGSILIESDGERNLYGPFEPWFERGSDPVYARASEDERTAFVRVMLLPREWQGKRTIRYVDAADEDKPKLQSARVFFDRPIVV
jgi:hypothetical protein